MGRWIFALIVIVSAGWIGSTALLQAQTEAKSAAVNDTEESERFAALEKALSGATMVGNFTITGQKKTELTAERYELKSVKHAEGEFWLFEARIRYGEHDVTLPLKLPVRWAGDTPVICVDQVGFPGLGVYTARVMIYANHYAGFWSGGDHGGHLFGIVERATPAATE